MGDVWRADHGLGAGTATYIARNVRDFNIAASPSYRTGAGAVATAGCRSSCTRAGSTRTGSSGSHARSSRASRGITGVRYPYPIYRVAEFGGRPGDGVARRWHWIPGFRSAADQAFLVSHETAHQWFYGIVGNDQATDAFADEAHGRVPFAQGAWASCVPAAARSTASTERSTAIARGCYYETIYVQGALFLDGLRQDFGERRVRRARSAPMPKDNSLGMGGNRRLLEAFRDEMGNSVLKRFRRRFPSLY